MKWRQSRMQHHILLNIQMKFLTLEAISFRSRRVRLESSLMTCDPTVPCSRQSTRGLFLFTSMFYSLNIIRTIYEALYIDLWLVVPLVSVQLEPKMHDQRCQQWRRFIAWRWLWRPLTQGFSETRLIIWVTTISNCIMLDFTYILMNLLTYCRSREAFLPSIDLARFFKR